jgi:hypothetical protein
VLNFFKIDRSELKGWLFCATPIGSRLAEPHSKKGRDIGPLDRQIREAIARIRPLLVGLDPFVKLHSLNENDSGDMDFVCDLLTRIAVETKIAVDIPHHVHKGSIAPGDADAGRGSSGIKDAGRLTYTLTPMSPNEARAFSVTSEERFSYVRLDSAKVNTPRAATKPSGSASSASRSTTERSTIRMATTSKSPSHGTRRRRGPDSTIGSSTQSSTQSTPV